MVLRFVNRIDMKQAKYDLINVLFVFPTDFSVLQFPFDHNL